MSVKTTTFQVISPIDQTAYAERQFATKHEIEAVLQNSQKATEYWKQTDLEERISICNKALTYYLENSKDIAEEISWQMGRPVIQAEFEITRSFKERVEYMLQIARASLADTLVEDSPQFYRSINREPIGTVLVLSPWNYPYLTSVNVIIPALVAGNTVILKHAAQTPLCAERYARAFEYAGLEEGVFQYLHLTHRQIQSVLDDPRINYLAFTGSVKGGLQVKQAIAGRFIQCGLELGGNDPAYVCDDADIEYTAAQMADGAFFNAGQSCCGIERIYVHRQVTDEFLEAFIAETKKFRLGHPMEVSTTLGPMVRTNAANEVRIQIEEALAGGAISHIKADPFELSHPHSAYLSPQILTRVNHRMKIMKEETFGPVVGIMEVDGDLQAVDSMNDSVYGLTASIWTQDDNRARIISEKIKAGTCFMNRCDYLDPALPWTGVKNSGMGFTLSQLGYQALTQPKSLHFKRTCR